jgi:hypothetical protein
MTYICARIYSFPLGTIDKSPSFQLFVSFTRDCQIADLRSGIECEKGQLSPAVQAPCLKNRQGT